MHAVILDSATLVPQSVVDSQRGTSFNNQLSTQCWDINARRLNSSINTLTSFAFTSTQQILEHSRDAEIIITNKVVLSAEILEQLPQLKLIVIAATGTNNIDLVAAKRLKIKVCNVERYSTSSVVQNCFTLILNLKSRFAELQSAMAQQGWHNQPQFVLLPQAFSELDGKTLGIIGQGTIGKAVANVAQAFGMQVIVAQLEHRPKRLGNRPLNEFLPQCDIVSLHCPLVDQTQCLVNQEFLSVMKPSALLINTARGGLIDEYHLADALKQRVIAGAGLDVLSVEPPNADNPLLSKEIPNLLITPHIGWASLESRQRLIDEIAENITAYTLGKPRNVVA